MQKHNKTVVHSTTRLEQGYHQGGYGSSMNYAFLGFRKNLYFVSDRVKELDQNFQPLDSKTILKGYGLEIETGCDGIVNNTEALCQVLEQICFEKLPSNLFKYQHDGSLGGRTSIECITQVMTKEFIRNNYPAWKYAFNRFHLFGIKPSASNGCGMHCNMSVALFGTTKEKQAEAIKKFVYFVNKYFRISCVLFHRTGSTGYCSQMSNWTNMDYAKSFDFDTLRESDSSHGVCWNLAHFPTGRVELRLVGGQYVDYDTDGSKTYYCFRNTMETIFHLVDTFKTISWKDIDDITKVFKGCNKYVLKRIDDVLAAGCITREQYDVIKNNIDTTVDFGNC